MPSPLVNDILNSLNREVLNQLDLAAAIAHPGESGRAREQIISAYLRRVIPYDFGVSTGFVFDAAGNISRQIDIVVYRNGYHPVLEIGGIKHFMIESVVAVIENKASVSSTEALHGALENIRSVKALDRTNGGKNYLVVGTSHGPKVNSDNFQHQVFGAIVTERSLSREKLGQELLCFLQANRDRRHWPNFYADVRNFSAMYLKSVNPVQATVIPSEAQYLGLTDSSAPNFVPPLLELTFDLVNFLRVTPVVDYKPTDYLMAGTGNIKEWWQL